MNKTGTNKLSEGMSLAGDQFQPQCDPMESVKNKKYPELVPL